MANSPLSFSEHMKVEIENQPHGVSTLKIELPSDLVRKEWDLIAQNYARYARIPGYRAGKAPKRVIETKFRKEIQEELTKKLVSKSYHEAIAEKQLRVVSLTNLDDVEFGEDQSMRFSATVVTAPEFQLPDYSNIPVELPDTAVGEAEVDAAIERLREQSADFIDVPDRAAEMEDFAVIDYSGTIEGQPINEIAPDASKSLQGGKKFWLRLVPDNFLPGFVEQVIGQKIGETRWAKVDFPADFPVAELAGKTGDYAATLNELKQRVLPELDDVFAAKFLPDKTLGDLRHALEHQLEHEKESELERAREAQVIKFLHDRIEFEVPQTLLKQETRRALSELVQRNRERGVPDDAMKSKEKELIGAAGNLASHRLKTNFILHRIADQEKLEVTRAELDDRIQQQATHYNVSVEKMRKELTERDAMNGLAEEVLLGKTLDLLKANVSVKTPPEATLSAETSDPIS